jgi:hypothetical protein
LEDVFWAAKRGFRNQDVYYVRQNQTNGELEELNWTEMEKRLKGVEWTSTDNIHAELKLYPAGNGSPVRTEKKSLGFQGPKKDNPRNKSTPLTGASPGYQEATSMVQSWIGCLSINSYLELRSLSSAQ